MSTTNLDQPTQRRKGASTYHPVLDLTPEGEIIRQARRELANRYGSRGTTNQLRAALTVLAETSRGAQ